MPNEIIPLNPNANLPAKVMSELNALRMSPERYYEGLIPIKADQPLTDTTPTLANIQQGLGAPGAKLAVSVALLELAEWYNVQHNLTDRQIAMIAEMILEVHWDLSLNDIKGCFQKKMRTAKLYGKLDGSDILGWLDEYKQECIEAKQRRLEEEAREFAPSEKPITYEEWSKNKKPEENYIARESEIGKPRLTPEQQRQKDLDFFKFRTEYLINKGITPK